VAEPVDDARRQELIELLQQVMKPEYVPVWLDRRVPVLDDATPNELLARGEYQAVAEVVSDLLYPGCT